MTKTKINYYKLSYLLTRRFNTFTIMLEELNYQEMSEVKGGISAEEYCAMLHDIIQNNDLDDGASAGAGYGWNRGDCGRFYSDILL